MRKRKKNKTPKMAVVRPEEQAFLRRWEGVKSAPTIFEKIDKDPAYENSLKSRIGEDPFGNPTEPTMGNKWGIGKPKNPN